MYSSAPIPWTVPTVSPSPHIEPSSWEQWRQMTSIYDPLAARSNLLCNAIAQRMKHKEGNRGPFAFVFCYEINEDHVVVFLVTEAGAATIIEDTSGAFPSDATIAALKLLAG